MAAGGWKIFVCNGGAGGAAGGQGRIGGPCRLLARCCFLLQASYSSWGISNTEPQELSLMNNLAPSRSSPPLSSSVQAGSGQHMLPPYTPLEPSNTLGKQRKRAACPIHKRPQDPSSRNNLAPSSPRPLPLAFRSVAIDPAASTPYRGTLASLSSVLHVGWPGSRITSDPGRQRRQVLSEAFAQS